MLHPIATVVVLAAVAAAAEPPVVPAVALCSAVRAPAVVADGAALVPGRDGWIFREGDLQPRYDIGDSLSRQLSRFVADLGSRGTRLAVVLLPPRGVLAAPQLDAKEAAAQGFSAEALAARYREAVAALARTGALAPDLLAAAERDGLGSGYYFARDHHWRPEGARSAMEALAGAARAAGLSFSPRPYTNVADKERSVAGSFSRQLERECGSPPLPVETMTRWRSVPSGPAGDSGALLDAAPPAEIVLVGASHTNKGNEDLMNVAGWLRAATGTDVLNAGVDAGGFDTGLLAWMDTPEARAHPPRLLVWEITARVTPAVEDFFRVGIPTLYGDCAQPLAQATAEARGGSTKLVSLPAGTQAGGSYLVLDVADRGLVKFAVSFALASGSTDTVHLKRATVTPNSGRFYVEAPLSTAHLVDVGLVAPEGTETTVATRVCRYPDDEAGVRGLAGAK